MENGSAERSQAVFGFGVFFGSGSNLIPVVNKWLRTPEIMKMELKVINTKDGFVVGNDYLAAGDRFPADFLTRTIENLQKELTCLLKVVGIDVTDDDFCVLVHEL